MEFVALIPLRGGSKSIPGKNILEIAGKPLALWTIGAASACPTIDAVFVATDDDGIKSVVESARLPKVTVISRGRETATDTASTESALLEFAIARTFTHLVLLQATSPMTTSADLQAGIQLYKESAADSLLSVVEQKRFIWEPRGNFLAEPHNYDPQQRPRRQEFPAYLVENGAFYISRRDALLARRCRISGKIATYRMPPETYYELDEPIDWLIIENLLQRRESSSSAEFQSRAKRVRILLTDVDGVLTDSGMYYSERGDELKKFNTRDGKGLERLRDVGLRVGILTSENTTLVKNRGRKLQLDFIYQGVTDKVAVVRALIAETGVAADEIAYIGDDVNDVALLGFVGLSACPADAVPEARRASIYHCAANGGGGCVREFCEQILQAKNAIL